MRESLRSESKVSEVRRAAGIMYPILYRPQANGGITSDPFESLIVWPKLAW